MRLNFAICKSKKHATVNRGLIALCAIILFSVAANAKGIGDNAMKANWSNPVMSHCLTSNTGNATIGTKKDTCKGNDDISCRNGDDTGVLMLVARAVNANGAKFCVTTVQSERKKKGNSWTLYYEPTQGQKCFWLCKPGFAGDGCNGTAGGCDSSTIKRDDFKNFSMARSINVESQIVMFHWDEYKDCGLNAKQEHDMILGISDWTPSGHGAFAQPFVVRGSRIGWNDNNAYIRVWKTGEPTLLCKSGYQPNGRNTDCEAINQNLCGLTELCAGGNWTTNGFDETVHELKYNNAKKCNEYRCSAPNNGFESASSKKCIDCGKPPLNGANADTGVCERCKVGEHFNQTLNKCAPTNTYTKSDMLYGKDKTEEQVDAFLQCWTMINPDQYRCCVIGGNWTNDKCDK